MRIPVFLLVYMGELSACCGMKTCRTARSHKLRHARKSYFVFTYTLHINTTKYSRDCLANAVAYFTWHASTIAAHNQSFWHIVLAHD